MSDRPISTHPEGSMRLPGLTALLLLALPGSAFAQEAATRFSGASVGPVPVEFILFGLVLLGVALFHNKTMQIAIGGAVVIALYKMAASPFRTGAGLWGFGMHLEHEWVILTNLLMLLVGFSLLARHFEDSKVPAVLPRFLPDDWSGGFVLLMPDLRPLELPRQHRRGADRRRDRPHRVQGQGPHRVPRRHRGRLERRRLRQRGRRHDDHDDVDRRRPPDRGVPRLRAGRSRRWRSSACRLAPAAALRPHPEGRRARRPHRLGARRRRRRHPGGGGGGQRDDQHPFHRDLGSLPVPRRLRLGRSCWSPRGCGSPSGACCRARSRARPSCSRWCCAPR